MARRRGASWQGSIKIPGTTKYPRYSFPTEALAEAWEKEAKEALKKGLPIPAPTVISKTESSLSRFFEDHHKSIWPDTMPHNVMSNQRSVVRFMGGDTLLHHITNRKLSEMVTAMREAGNKNSTINTRLSHLKVLLRYAKRLEMVDTVLDFPWQDKGDNSRMRFLTEDEEGKLLALMSHWALDDMRALTEALIDTGCRPSELITGVTKGAPIRWSEVSVSAGGTAPDVNDPTTGLPKAVISLMRTKTGKYRVLPLTERAKSAFLRSKENGDARPFGNLRTDDASALFRKCADHLQMHDVVLYTCRHTCASRLVQRGADIRRVMQWMGHTNIKTTLGYAKLTPTDIFGIGDLL